MFVIKTPEIKSFEELSEYLVDLEVRIEDALKLGEYEKITLQQLTVALDKPRNGDVINADGTNYDPGGGAGIYLHNGTIYEKV